MILFQKGAVVMFKERKAVLVLTLVAIFFILLPNIFAANYVVNVNGKNVGGLNPAYRNGQLEISAKPFLDSLGFDQHNWVANAQTLMSTRSSDNMKTNIKVGQKDIIIRTEQRRSFVVIDKAPAIVSGRLTINEDILTKVFKSKITKNGNIINISTNLDYYNLLESLNNNQKAQVAVKSIYEELPSTTTAGKILENQYDLEALKEEVKTIKDFYILMDALEITWQDGYDSKYRENNITWSYNKTSEEVLETRTINCGGIANLANYLLKEDYDMGYIRLSRENGGHVINYFDFENYFLVIDFSNYISIKRVALSKHESLEDFASNNLYNPKYDTFHKYKSDYDFFSGASIVNDNGKKILNRIFVNNTGDYSLIAKYNSREVYSLVDEPPKFFKERFKLININ